LNIEDELMAFQTDINMDGLVPVSRPMPRAMPPIDLQPLKSPFLISSLPTTATVNPDSIRNFTTPGIPNFRITPPPPLSSTPTNNIASVKVLPVLLQPTPAPTIASPLVSIPTGFTFSFNQVRLPLSSTLAISSYKIYRGSANNSASASVIQAVPHHPAGVGVPVVIQDSQPNGVTAFYWVSSVATSGQESNLTSAQTAGVTSNAIANANSQIASSAHMNPLNVSFAPASATVLTNDGVTSAITIVANTNQFGFGQVAYNSGSAAVPIFGISFIYTDDPQFLGGSVIYQFSSGPQAQTAADGRLSLGTINTALTFPGTGGGFSGGTGGAGGAGGLQGGRGFTF
jgi:hypothetical protein